MAPTVVVARIALANPSNSRVSTLTTDMSGMQFEGRYMNSQLEPKIDDEGTRTITSSLAEWSV